MIQIYAAAGIFIQVGQRDIRIIISVFLIDQAFVKICTGFNRNILIFHAGSSLNPIEFRSRGNKSVDLYVIVVHDLIVAIFVHFHSKTEPVAAELYACAVSHLERAVVENGKIRFCLCRQRIRGNGQCYRCQESCRTREQRYKFRFLFHNFLLSRLYRL